MDLTSDLFSDSGPTERLALPWQQTPVSQSTITESELPKQTEPMGAGDMLAYPFQVAGGLIQGAANFLVSANTAAIGATMEGLSSKTKYPLNNLVHDDDDLVTVNEYDSSWAKSLDKWAKDFDVIFDAAASHPVFDPTKLGRGSEDVQSLLGAFSVWVEEDAAKAAGDKVMRMQENPELAKKYDDIAGLAAMAETAVVGLGLMVPYFGVKGAKTAYGKFKDVSKANKTGNIKETATGRKAITQDVRTELYPPMDYEVVGVPGNVGPRPGPMRSTNVDSTFVNAKGEMEIVKGQQEFEHTFLRENKGASPEAAKAAWYEYANEVTRSAYPDAYMAYEMKASGFNALAAKARELPLDPNQPQKTGRQLYLEHIFDARNTNNVYGYRNSFTYQGYTFNLKDYITYTPAEFFDVVNNSDFGKMSPEGRAAANEARRNQGALEPRRDQTGPRDKFWTPPPTRESYAARSLSRAERLKLEPREGYPALPESDVITGPQAAYVEYINQKAAELGMDPVSKFSEATTRAFELREMEVAKLKIAQQEMAWREEFLKSENLSGSVGQAVADINAARGQVAPTPLPKSLKDVMPSKEGPNYTSEQVQSFFENNAARDIFEAQVADSIHKATQPLGMAEEAPARAGFGRKQSGVARPEVFGEGSKILTEKLVEIVGPESAKKLVTSGVGLGAGEVGRPKPSKEPIEFSNEARSAFGGATRTTKGSFIKSSAGEIMGFTNAIDAVRPFEAVSPTLKKIVEKFDRPLEGGGKPTMTPYSETVKLREAEWDQKVRKAMSPLQPTEHGKYGGISAKDNAALNAALRDPKMAAKLSTRARTVYDNIRKLLDEDYKAKIEAGIPGLSDKVSYLKGYFHRAYDGNKILKMEQEFLSLLEEYGIEKAMAEEIFTNLTTHDRLFKVEPRSIDDFLMEKPSVMRRSSVDYERGLRMLPDSKLAPFLHDNVYSTLSKYGSEWTRRQTYAERFGANNEVLRAELMQAAKEAAAAGKPLPKWVAQRVYDLAQAMDGAYKPMASRTAKTAQRGAISAVNIALMSKVTLSSIPELALVMQTVGIKDFAKSIPPTLGVQAKRIARRMFKDIPHSLREEIIKGTGIAMDAAVQERLTALSGMDFSKVDSAVFKLYGLHHWTKFAKISAVNAFIAHAESLMKATKDQKTLDTWLKKGGFNAAKAKHLTEFMDFYGLDLMQGKDWIAKGKPKDHPFYGQMVRGSLRFAEDSVLTPNPATVPMWHSNPHFAIVKHLRTFQSLMFTRVLSRWGRNLSRNNMYDNALYGRNIASAITGMLGVAYLVNELKDQLKYGDKKRPFDTSAGNMVIRSIESSGLFGPASAGYDTFINSKTGSLGVMAGPLLSTVGEGTMHMGNWLTDKNSKSFAKFLARKSGPLGGIETSEKWLEKKYERGLKAIRGKPKSRDWR